MKQLSVLVTLSFIIGCGGMESPPEPPPEDTINNLPNPFPPPQDMPPNPFPTPEDIPSADNSLEAKYKDPSFYDPPLKTENLNACYQNFRLNSNVSETIPGISQDDSSSQQVRVLKLTSEDGAFITVGNKDVDTLVFVAEEMHHFAVAVFYLDKSTAPIGYKLYGYIGSYGCTSSSGFTKACPRVGGFALWASDFGTASNPYYYLYILGKKSPATALYIRQTGEGSTAEVTIGQGTSSTPTDLYVDGTPMGNSKEDIFTLDDIILTSPKKNISADKFVFRIPCSGVPVKAPTDPAVPQP
jgi:hypothetical protein